MYGAPRPAGARPGSRAEVDALVGANARAAAVLGAEIVVITKYALAESCSRLRGMVARLEAQVSFPRAGFVHAGARVIQMAGLVIEKTLTR